MLVNSSPYQSFFIPVLRGSYLALFPHDISSRCAMTSPNARNTPDVDEEVEAEVFHGSMAKWMRKQFDKDSANFVANGWFDN